MASHWIRLTAHMFFVFMYIGINNCTINVHSLLHLPYYVKLLGPLWTHSTFSFENNIHNLLNHSHASHGIGKQVKTYICSYVRTGLVILLHAMFCDILLTYIHTYGTAQMQCRTCFCKASLTQWFLESTYFSIVLSCNEYTHIVLAIYYKLKLPLSVILHHTSCLYLILKTL